jgi:hypothetical protein
MSSIAPRRLALAAGLALAVLGCSSKPTAQQAAKPATPPPAPAPTVAAPTPPPAPQPPAAEQGARRESPATRGPTPAGRFNGTPAELAQRPGTYFVLNGKPDKVPAVKLGDRATVARIIDEGKNRNQVMDHLTHLTTKLGPRLTGSSRLEAANRWAMEQFQSWGLESHLHQWGTIPVRFDRGPSHAKVGTMRESGEFRPTRDLEFTAPAWSAGTNGPVRGQIIKMPETEEQYEAVKDKLAGSWILIKASGQGRRGVGPMSGGAQARQRFFAETRRKIESGELKLQPDAQPEETQPEPQPAPEAKPAAPTEGIAGAWEGTATGGRIPEGGAPFTLEFKVEGDTVTGTMGYPNYHSGPIKDGKWDNASRTLTFSWEGPGGAGTYSFKLDGQTLSGQSQRDENTVIALSAKRPQPAEAAAPQPEAARPARRAERPKGPSIDERVFMHAPAGYISASGDELVRTSGNFRNLSMANLPKDVEITVRSSDYDYINSRVSDGGTIHLEVNLDHTFVEGPIPVYNTIAEIKGSELPDEVVIISAHLDSWDGPGSLGTTDNATGSSVTLEAARMLAAVGAKPKRTIRFILWTGEEQGLLGSRAYVRELKEKDLLKNISAVFVDDGGTNFQGGLHCLDSQVEFLAAATAPVNGVFWSSTDQRFLDVNIQPGRRMGGGISGGSSDHASFLAEGVPGYFWDEVGRANYGYGWHTQNDKLDLAIPEYLIQSSTCSAITAYNLANAPTLLPRQPLPQKEEEKKDTTADAGWRASPTTSDPITPEPATSTR